MVIRMIRFFTAILAPAALLACTHGIAATDTAGRPEAGATDIVEQRPVHDSIAQRMLTDVRAYDPSVLVEARYATSNNFTGAPLPGYLANRALLRVEAARALADVQATLALEGYGLKVFDGYRPVRATEAMVDWTRRTGRTDLLRDGYIASRSRHNLGLAVDLTLVDRATGRELDMGTPYDTFSADAHTANATGEVAARRAVLVRAMHRHNFRNYEQEWWHFSFEAPNPLRFDIVIQ